MALFPHHELTYYFFGLSAGVKNLATNGWRLGVKKTAGKIAQPIHPYTRFAEYDCFVRAIREHLRGTGEGARILDVGSPKMLGLYLASTAAVEVTLTDISELNVSEYQSMWRGLERGAKGKASFALADARALHFGDAEFDVVYSMSVVEHIESDGGDAQAVREFLRVLKPGGLLLLSVPLDSRYAEQDRAGFVGAVRRTGDQEAYFFQRIYDQAAFEERILKPAAGLEAVVFTTIGRRRPWMARSFGALGENLRGALGFLNPVLSALVNRTRDGIDGSFTGRYEKLHTARDVYCDLVMSGIKRR